MKGRQREKRSSDVEERDDLQLQPKRARIPTLASVVFGISKKDYLQRLFCSSLEPMFRKVVQEEVDRALKNGGPVKISERCVPRQIEGPNRRNLQLHFKTKLSLPIFTSGNIGGENGVAIQVCLCDANSGLVVTSEPESCSKLDVLVLEGDFNNEDGDSQTEEDFNIHQVTQRKGKRPLLIGDLQITLKDGIGTLGELYFTDNSSWVRSRKFKIGVRIASGYCNGIRIREATTEAFIVRDHRGEVYKKHYPPSLKDEVWRLEKIGKDGQFHKRLSENHIDTVEHFLKNYNRCPQQLREILGSGMPSKMWESLVAHAKTCVIGDMRYIYYPNGTGNTCVFFNMICEFLGLIYDGNFYTTESLSDHLKALADKLIKEAYDNWMHVKEYDGETQLNFTLRNRENYLKKEPQLTPSISPARNQVSQMHLQSSIFSNQHSVEMGKAVGGRPMSAPYDGIQAIRHAHRPQDEGSHAPMPIERASIEPQRDPAGSTFQTQFTGQSMAHPDLEMPSSFKMDALFENEISLSNLGNEDLFAVCNMGVASTSSLHDNLFGFSYMPSFFPFPEFDNGGSRTSNKAIVGWLKMKAAMRWGIFVRKRAAEKRRATQLVEV